MSDTEKINERLLFGANSSLFLSFWRAFLRLCDDMKEIVREQAFISLNEMQKYSLKLIGVRGQDIDNDDDDDDDDDNNNNNNNNFSAKTSEKALSIIIPFLLNEGNDFSDDDG